MNCQDLTFETFQKEEHCFCYHKVLLGLLKKWKCKFLLKLFFVFVICLANRRCNTTQVTSLSCLPLARQLVDHYYYFCQIHWFFDHRTIRPLWIPLVHGSLSQPSMQSSDHGSPLHYRFLVGSWITKLQHQFIARIMDRHFTIVFQLGSWIAISLSFLVGSWIAKLSVYRSDHGSQRRIFFVISYREVLFQG